MATITVDRIASKARRGGKPKGHKRQGAQVVVGNPHVSEAENAFLLALNVALPSTAFDQLLSGSIADVPAWATRWGIHAPCVIREATSLVMTAATIPDAPADILRQFSESHSGFEYPESWRVEYVRLNLLPVDTGYLEDVLQRVATEQEIAANERRLGMAVGAMTGVREACAAERAAALDEECVLAPIAADPVREGRSEFLRRAANHWDGREARARRILRNDGIATAAPTYKRGIRDYIDWLVRRRVHRERQQDIAVAAHVAPATVRDGVRQAMKLLGLTRRLPAGRPRTRIPKHGNR